LNTGIATAQGRYILPLDADNTLFERALETLAGVLDERRELHITYGNVEFLKTDGERWHSGWPPPFKVEWQVLRNERSERANNLIPSTAMYRREVWELTGGYRRRYRTAEDADFWTRAASYGLRAERVTTADIFTYRDREGSMSRVERTPDWTLWMPWSRAPALLPSGAAFEEQLPIPSFEPTLISVVIPVGPGHEELLVDALDSVDAQTFRLWECIVINDTGAPLRWTPSWARVINTTGSIGVAAARNLGLRHAKARLFLPLDADDTLEPEALSRLYEAQRELGGYIYSDWYDKFEGRELKTWATPEYNSRELLTKGCLHAITALYPIEAWQQVGGFDEELPAWEDWDFQLRLARAGICGSRYPMPLFTYRKDTGQRREENYAEFERSKQGILDKWKAHFEGKETFMGCGCGGKKASLPKASIQRQVALPPDSEEYATVEFTGAQQGARTFRGPSGQVYRFSALQSEKMKLVSKADVEFFLARRDFRLVERREPVEVVS
jgi:glycosyltransferase involved in cell wall biosynthesis